MLLESFMAGVQLQSDQVNSLAAPAGRQLDAGYETNSGRFTGAARLVEPGGGVVIGERQGGDPARPRPLRNGRRCQHTIRKMAVCVEIDQCLAAHIHLIRMIRAA